MILMILALLLPLLSNPLAMVTVWLDHNNIKIDLEMVLEVHFKPLFGPSSAPQGLSLPKIPSRVLKPIQIMASRIKVFLMQGVKHPVM